MELHHEPSTQQSKFKITRSKVLITAAGIIGILIGLQAFEAILEKFKKRIPLFSELFGWLNRIESKYAFEPIKEILLCIYCHLGAGCLSFLAYSFFVSLSYVF